MRVATYFSADAESVYSLQQCASKQWELDCLFRPVSRYVESPFFCRNRELIEFCAEAIGKPLEVIELSEREMFDVEGYLDTLKKRGVDALAFGRLARLAHVQLESLCSARSMQMHVFLKTGERAAALQTLVQQGYELTISSIEDGPSSLLGVALDQQSLTELTDAKGARFETVVLDGPLFLRRVEVSVGYPEVRSESEGVYHFRQLRLERKQAL